jgi:D-alanine-D-alanine ligase-like ATP-grasp enzyme
MKNCFYCGNNPINHRITKISETVALINRPLQWIGSSWLGRVVSQLLEGLMATLIKIGIRLKVVTASKTIKLASTGRSQVIWEEAERRGIAMQQLVIGERKLDVYMATLPTGKTIIFESLPIPTHRQTTAIRWMDDKMELKKRLLAAGLPVARGGAFYSFRSMLKRFREIDKPVIVKPAAGSRGRHTTTFIYTEEQLREAYTIGKQIAHKLVMEEHLFGSVYRATLIDGVLAGVLRGDPPRITGDGVHTIKALIDLKNKNRRKEVKPYVIGPLTGPFLARSGYTLESIIPAGKTIDLSEKIGVSYGGFAAEDSPICHPEIKKILEQAGAIVNFPVIGFDFIIPDLTKDPREQKWGIIESNSLPFIDLHHHPVEGPAINVAGMVWDLWSA